MKAESDLPDLQATVVQEMPSSESPEQKQGSYYENSLQHLRNEMLRLDLLIHWQIDQFRRQESDLTSQQYRGLFISEEEINDILNEKTAPNSTKEDTLRQRIQEMNEAISQRVTTSLERGMYLSLVYLTQLFHLSPFEIDCLLVALAPEMDLKYEKLYGYLQNDVTRKRPTVDLCLQLFCPTLDEKANARSFFSASAPLFKYRLLTFPDESNEKKSPLLARTIKLEDRVVDFLLEIQAMEPRIAPFVHLITPREKSGNWIIPGEIRGSLRHLTGLLSGEKKIEPSVLYLRGTGDNSQRQAAEALCREINFLLLKVDLEGLVTAHQPPEFSMLLELILREALLQSCALYISGGDALLESLDKTDHKTRFINTVKEFGGIVFLEGNRDWQGVFRAVPDFRHHFFQLDFFLPCYESRKKLWEFYLKHSQLEEGVDIAVLANMFRLTGGQIRGAVRTAQDMALIKRGNTPLSMADIADACRSISNRKLAALSRKITPRYSWGDIILPVDNLNRLYEISNYVKYRHVVYDQWGFDKKLSLGKGLNALFHGSSGTGKTMAAEIIANDLGLDLYKIDLSTVVSKYIGETEKNLNKIFQEAETSNAILFFDEADALFGKRSEVKDAHDRYANIEVAYLLQKMEEYEGIVILATNLLKNIDEAFVRRVHFSLEFPFPDETQRRKIWESIFPAETPRNDDIDYEFLSKKFKLSGGNIKNIVLTAAFFAAEEQGIIGMKHLVKGLKRELQKMGKLSMQSDFDRYNDITEEK